MKNNKKFYLLIATLLCMVGCKNGDTEIEPTVMPTIEPTLVPIEPTVEPSEPTIEPTPVPTVEPTVMPTVEPTPIPSEPTVEPSEPTVEPTPVPSEPEPTVSPSEEIIVSGEVSFVDYDGYEEGLYANFNKVESASSYNVYYANSSSEQYIKVDSMLIREYQDYMRVDVLGLKEGTYKLKVCPVINDVESSDIVGEISGLQVISHNREGFAFSNNQIPGAYNLDGTLKNNAVVIYVTDSNKDSISYEIVTSSKGTKEKLTGLQNIIYGFKKGYDNRPLCIRLIGKVTDMAVLESGDIVIDSGRKHSSGLTIEGVGTDAVAYGWGIRVKNASHVEIRNLATMAVDSDEGDNIGLQQNNEYIWVHDNDFFYGDAGSDADQAKGDGALDCKKSNYVTMSYNHFFDTGKANLLGNNGGEVGYLITYHHNWYDHSDSRHPRVRQYSAHVYNNYYDGNSKYGIGNTQGGNVFSEANYFRNCKYPMLISKQGSDISGDGKGTFSGEDGGIIKSFNNYIEGAKSYVTYQQNNIEFDAYEVSSKDEKIPSSVVTKQGSHTYDNFDTNESIMYEYNVQTPIEAKEDVIAKAGRLDGGDFKWTFTEADDTSYDVDTKLKEAIFNYKSSIVKIGNDEIKDEENDENGGNIETNPPVIEGAISHSFTDDGLESDFFNISGNLSSSKGTVNYNGLTLTRCLKIESSTSITFNIDKPMKLILVFNEGINKNIYVDEVKQAISNGVLELTLQEGQHSIRKDDSINLYYIQLIEVE